MILLSTQDEKGKKLKGSRTEVDQVLFLIAENVKVFKRFNQSSGKLTGT
jgi:hypothetical protein